MIDWDDSNQGTVEWFNARAGVITGSKVEDARKFLKTGKPSSERVKYSYKLAVEQKFLFGPYPQRPTIRLLWFMRRVIRTYPKINTLLAQQL